MPNGPKKQYCKIRAKSSEKEGMGNCRAFTYQQKHSEKSNLVTVWLDYGKFFDSIPHSWLLHARKLSNLSNHLVTTIKNLTESWYTELNVNDKDYSRASNVIKIIRGLYQGDNLSVIHLVLALNLLPHLRRSTKGYAWGKNRHHQQTPKLFVYDLKWYAADMKTVITELEIVKKFPKDIDMKFGENKCVFLCIEKGLIKKS